MTSRAIVVAASAALLSCGDDADSATDAAANLPLARAPSAYAMAYCERVFGCCSAGELAELFPAAQPPITDLAGCREYVTRVFGNEFVDDTMRAETAGHARYDGVAMAACIEHLRGDSCEHLARVLRLMTLPVDCPPVRLALAELGSECDHDFQCTTVYCEGGAENQVGICRVLPALGETCPDNRCVAGAYCDRTTDPSGRCTLLKTAGEPCTSLLECVDFACLGAPSGVCGAPTTCNGVP